MEDIQPITKFEWVSLGRRQALFCSFQYSSYVFLLSFNPTKHRAWLYEKRSSNGKVMLMKGAQTRSNITSVAKLGAALGIPSLALSEVMRQFEEMQALRTIASFGEEDTDGH